MNQFGKNGLPCGTTIRICSALDKSLLGRKQTIVMPLQWHCGIKKWVYGIDLPLAGCNTSWIEPHQLTLVEFPYAFYNWCYNKITLLCEHSDEITRSLNEEKLRGEFP